MSKRSSDVWLFFEVQSESSGVAVCNLCHKTVSRGGKSRTTTNLKKHLKIHHPNELYHAKIGKKPRSMETSNSDNPDIETETSAGESRNNETSAGNLETPLSIETENETQTLTLEHTPRPSLSSRPTYFSPPSTSQGFLTASPSSESDSLSLTQCSPGSSLVSPNLRLPSVSPSGSLLMKMPKTKQPTLESVIRKKTKYRPDDLRAREITRKITEMICLDNQPLSVVEDVGFKNLINFLDPRYDMPSRKYFSTIELPKLYDLTKKKVVERLKTAEYVSITTDMWTSTANDDYMAVTCHFVDNEFQWNHICLEVIPFPEINHMGEAISTFLTDVLRDWNILQKIHIIVRDNGRNVVAAMNIGGFIGIPCLAHTLQLVVKDGLLHQRAIMNIASACRRTVGHFKHSSKATKALKAAQETLGLPTHKLIQDEPTRWNSTKHMFDRLLEQRRPLALAAPELNLPSELSNNDWELVEKITKLLKIFDDATFQASSPSTTISEVIPIVNTALKELEPSTEIFGVKSFATELIQSLKSRYSDLEETPAYALATILDPRLKAAVFLSATNVEKAKEMLLEEANNIFPRNISGNANLQVRFSIMCFKLNLGLVRLK